VADTTELKFKFKFKFNLLGPQNRSEQGLIPPIRRVLSAPNNGGDFLRLVAAAQNNPSGQWRHIRKEHWQSVDSFVIFGEISRE
jgi:hypothetical protein